MRPTTFSADVTTTLKRLVYAHTSSFFSMLISVNNGNGCNFILFPSPLLMLLERVVTSCNMNTKNGLLLFILYNRHQKISIKLILHQSKNKK